MCLSTIVNLSTHVYSQRKGASATSDYLLKWIITLKLDFLAPPLYTNCLFFVYLPFLFLNNFWSSSSSPIMHVTFLGKWCACCVSGSMDITYSRRYSLPFTTEEGTWLSGTSLGSLTAETRRVGNLLMMSHKRCGIGSNRWERILQDIPGSARWASI